MSFIGKFAAALALIALFVLGLVWAVGAMVEHKLAGPDPVTIASGSLQGLREQNRLSAFAARFVAVTTTKQQQLVFSTEKTLIMPGNVRYEVDLGRRGLRKVLLAATKTSSVEPATAEAFTREVFDVVTRHGGDYDGWGGPVEQ